MYTLPFTYLTVMRLGISSLMLVAFSSASAWAKALTDSLPPEGVLYLRKLHDAMGQVPLGEGMPLRLGLAAAAELHLAAHLSGVLTVAPVWDEISAPTTAADILAAELPPGISLPAPDADALTVRSAVGLVATDVIRYLENHFGADVPAFAANRAVAVRLAEQA